MVPSFPGRSTLRKPNLVTIFVSFQIFLNKKLWFEFSMHGF